MGFGAAKSGVSAADDLHERIAQAVRGHLRPELLNRISRTVVFNPLTPQDVRAIAGKFIARLNERLAGQNLRLTLDEAVYALLMEKGFSPAFGARPMERAIEALIAQPLARAILESRVDPGTKLLASLTGTKVTFKRVGRAANAPGI